MKIFCVTLDNKKELISVENLRNKIIEVAPNSKEGFEKFGDWYLYNWITYFYNELLGELRREVSGDSDMARDVESIERIGLSSRTGHMNISVSLEKIGLPSDFIKYG